MELVQAEAVFEAVKILDGNVVKTPTMHSATLSSFLNTDIFLKLETLQYTGSFKDRGSYIKLTSLNAEQRKNGVIAMSAGNHAQGVAYHAKNMGIPATIIMPTNTPLTKIMKTEQHNANVILHGLNINEAEPLALELAKKHNYTFISPYDDPKIIAGQGTIAIEMLDAVPELDVIIVPIGGGGLISGIGLMAKHIKPEIEVIGVEAELYPSMYQLLNNLKPQMGGDTIAEGIAVKTPGLINQEMTRKYVDDILLLQETYLEQAISTLLEYGRILAEGAGAAGIAALLQHGKRFAGKKVGVVICGANIDMRILSSIMIRGMIRTQRYVYISVEIVDAPGSLAKVSSLIAEKGGNIIEVDYHRMIQDLPVKQSVINISIESRNQAHSNEIIQSLEENGFHVHNIPLKRRTRANS